MNNRKVKSIVKNLGTCNIVELQAVVKQLRAEYGETTARHIITVLNNENNCLPTENEFFVELVSNGDYKIRVIKTLGEFFNCGLKEAKNISDRAGSKISIVDPHSGKFAALPEEEARKLKTALQNVGATVNLHPAP